MIHMKSLRKFHRPIHPKCILIPPRLTTSVTASCLVSCSSLLSDLLPPFSLSPFPRLISPQQADHPLPCSEPSKAPDRPQDEISHMSCKICPWEHFLHFLSLLPYFFLSICLFPTPLTWQTVTASIYHHLGLFPWKCVLGCLPTFGWVSLQRHLCKEPLEIVLSC